MSDWVEYDGKKLYWTFMAPKVLAVAVVHPRDDRRRPRPKSLNSRNSALPEWEGFIADAKGKDGAAEAPKVADKGQKLSKKISRALWPELHNQGLHYRE